jgi:D-lyxose ketol-isomerase
MDGIGYTVSGEVSSVCDDWRDNVFLDPAERFPMLAEDEPRRAYLCHEYPLALRSTVEAAPLYPCIIPRYN